MLETVIILASTVVATVSCVRCRHTPDQAVTRWTVDCSGMNLSSTPPATNFHPVITLNLSHNIFAHLVDSQFENWTYILHLDMSSNHLTTIDKNAFKGLSNLVELNLMNNSIEFVSENITNHITKLKILNLSFNSIQKIFDGSFQRVPQLFKLFLSNNKDLGKEYNNYKDLIVALNNSLISLDISNCSLSEIPQNTLANSTKLISLNLAHNPLTIIPQLPLSLRSLNISSTHLESIPLDLFRLSDLLEKLYLQDMPILKYLKARSLNGLSHLQELVIKDCPNLSLVSEDVFGDSAPRLRKLVISNCKLTTLSHNVEHLLDRVFLLDLQNNPWICDGRIIWFTKKNISSSLTENLRYFTLVCSYR